MTWREVEEVEGPQPLAPVPVHVHVMVDISDPVGAIGVSRSFDHEGFLEATAKSGRTIREWQKHSPVGHSERLERPRRGSGSYYDVDTDCRFLRKANPP